MGRSKETTGFFNNLNIMSNKRYLNIVFNTPAKGIFTYSRKDDSVCETGFRVSARFGRRNMTGFVIDTADSYPEGDFQIRSIDKVIDSVPVFTEKSVELAKWISKMYLCSLGEAIAVMLPGGKRESRIPVYDDEETEIGNSHKLSNEQEHAVSTITASEEGMFYLFGVTGSGKTEVFLKAAEKTLMEGRGIIYLVPEISLTHQLTVEVKSRFKESVAIFHSSLTPSQRLVEWMRIKKGEVLLVIGARSAVFAPMEKIGLIIIDEEHEGSYKSGSTPRYHARQVAMKRCALSNARLVMGSATPSIEAYYLMNEGRIKKLLLPKRLSGGGMPEIAVVDMKKSNGAISRQLEDELRKTYEEGRQSILFLNRRGFSYFFHCKTCGYEMKCRQCSVSLTYHKNRNKMVCHYCGFTKQPVDVCPECSSLDVGYSGFGTELIEEEVRGLFPGLRISRVDTDSIKKKGTLKKLLDDFKKGEIDILLGTQMVAKGLNFPGVKLVGIVLADTGLHLPDFRAQERTFALIVQVSGRAGRYMPDGKVIIQTYRPENEAVKLAARGKIREFYNKELEIREMLRFPPFTRLFRIVFRGKDRNKVYETAGKVASLLRKTISDSELLGPSECPLSVISGNLRHQIIIRTSSFSKTHAAVADCLNSFKPNFSVYIEIDVDPVSLL